MLINYLKLLAVDTSYSKGLVHESYGFKAIPARYIHHKLESRLNAKVYLQCLRKRHNKYPNHRKFAFLYQIFVTMDEEMMPIIPKATYGWNLNFKGYEDLYV